MVGRSMLDQRPEAVLDGVAILARGGRVLVDLVEFRNVGAGAEMPARALEKHDKRVGSSLDRGLDRGQRAPHGARDGVAPLGAVQDDAGERRLEAQGDVGHGLFAKGTAGCAPSGANAGLEQTASYRSVRGKAGAKRVRDRSI